MAGRPPSDLVEEFVENTFKLNTQGLHEKYKKALNTISEWRTWCRRRGYEVGYGAGTSVEHEDVTFNILEPDTQVVSDIEEALIRLRKAGEGLDIRETEAEYDFKDLPVMVVFWGDWHIGNEATILERLLEDKKTIIETDGLFFVGMGDYRSNLGRAPFKSCDTDVLVPGWQDMLALQYASDLKGKALGYLVGCHDFFQTRQDEDLVKMMCQRSEAKHFWHQCSIRLHFRIASYKGVVRHKVTGRESTINTTNAMRAMYEKEGNPNFIGIAHKHYGDLQHKANADKTSETLWVRSGTYMIRGEFSKKLGDYACESMYPAIVFLPDREKMLGYRDFRDGIPALRQLRAVYKDGGTYEDYLTG